MNLKYFAAGAIAALGLAVSAAPANAAYVLGYNYNLGPTLTVNGVSFGQTFISANTGWFASDGYHYAGNTNYGITTANDPDVAAIEHVTTAHNGFMVFDFGDLLLESELVTDASITMYQGFGTDGDGNYVSGANSNESVRLGSYVGDPGEFDSDRGINDSTGIAIFNALAGGVAYGYQYFGPSDDGKPGGTTFSLNGNFITDLNAAVLYARNNPGGRTTIVFGETFGVDPGPTSPGPEPATWAMMIMGFLGAGVMLRRRRAAAAAA